MRGAYDYFDHPQDTVNCISKSKTEEMAKSKKTKSQKSRKKATLRDERIPKIVGIIAVLIAIYLAIAFVSYLYTWKTDQDKVLHFTWDVMLQKNLVVENWLGRLGAMVSNAFFYWGFGISSMAIVILLAKLGLDLIRRQSLRTFIILARNTLLLMAFMSIVLEFIFNKSDFAWGGAFGESSYIWLSNFMGQIGLFFLLAFLLFGYLIWQFNPNLNQMNFSLGNLELKMPDFAFFKKIFPEHINDTSWSDDEEVITKDDENHQSSKEVISETIVSEETSSTMTLDVSEPTLRPTSKPKNKVKDSVDLDLEFAAPKEAGVSSEPGHQFEVVKQESTVPADMNVHKDDQKEEEPYDPTLDLSNYKAPTLDLLESYADQKFEIDRSELEANKNQIIETLLNYKIEITKIRATIGPTVTLYEIVPAPGVKISKIKNLEDDIALSLAALGIRIIAPIPGKGTIGIEVPNKKKQIVSLKEVLNSEKFQNSKMALPIALGKTISNEVFVADLAKMPHLLIAGATGQGKSVGINAVLMSLLYKKHPSQVKIVMVDPKKVELFPYSTLDKHFLGVTPDADEPIVTDTSKVVQTLNSLCVEMDERYDLLKKARARNIKEYNEKFTSRQLNPNNGHKFLPYIVLVIDEFADLMMTAGKEVEMPIARLAQLARAIGIHLIIATQRPSVNIITGIIKANFPARIAFKVTSKVDSRTILDAGGADQLIGRGDMLLSVGSNVVRLQCAFVDTPEVERVIDHISEQQGYAEPYFLPEFNVDGEIGDSGSNLSFSDLDDNFADAARLVISNNHGSTSSIQRSLQLGYNRAGRIMDQMEALGIVGPQKGSKPREVLYHSVEEFERYWESLQSNNQMPLGR